MNCAILDDSNIITQMIMSSLKPYGFNPTHFKGEKVNDSNFPFTQYDLFIVNRTISSIDGCEFIKTIRLNNTDSYIVGIITKGDWREKVEMLEAGADDVLNYPFPMQELVVRIQNLIGRPRKRAENKYKIGNAIVDINSRRVMLNDKAIYLRNKEFRILEYLTRNNNRAVSRSEILDNVWDYRSVTSSNTVDVHISNIRKKLKGENLIRTIHGFGYKIQDNNGKPSEESNNEDKIDNIPTIS